MITKLSILTQFLLLITSFILVAFGQPAWSWWMGLATSCFGIALFWRLLLDIPEKSKRFYLAMAWYGAVQIVQFSWMLSHPYLYIYGVVLFCAALMGLQFGIITMFIQRKLFTHFYHLLAVAGLWTIMEWSRLFILSGLSFNPIGIALTGSIYSLQMASLGGVYLLSFWVILTNLSVLGVWVNGFNAKKAIAASVLIGIPYIFGFAHILYQDKKSINSTQKVSAVLVQTGFPVEELMGFMSAEEARNFVLDQWHHILALVNKHKEHSIDLIALPEYVVPYGTYHAVFPLKDVKRIFKKVFGEASFKKFPPLKSGYADYIETDKGYRWLVSNAFFLQALANQFNSDVIAGLEDSTYVNYKKAQAFSSAFYFSPGKELAVRYDKRVLVPMGEYIPFAFCREFVAKYGIVGSFTPGEKPKVFQGKVPYSPSICYEETYGSIIREGRVEGAEFLVNLTNDGWFPNSRLPQQHFDHARLRTVENGVPLARACNSGVTCGLDSLGRIIGVLGEDSFKDQWKSDSLYVKIPTYHYKTVYSKFGDLPILLFSLLCLLGFIGLRLLISKK